MSHHLARFAASFLVLSACGAEVDALDSSPRATPAADVVQFVYAFTDQYCDGLNDALDVWKEETMVCFDLSESDYAVAYCDPSVPGVVVSELHKSCVFDDTAASECLDGMEAWGLDTLDVLEVMSCAEFEGQYLELDTLVDMPAACDRALSGESCSWL